MFGIKTIFMILIYLFNTIESYPLICPSPSQWRLRSDSFNNCSLGDHYMCLFNRSSESNTELCRKPEVLHKGLRLIWHGDINSDNCSEDRFQPFNFWTNGSSTCVNIKSKCNEEGQIKYENGTGSKDVTCICDSTKGFQFLYTPMNTISCIPSEEDCTCFANETVQIVHFHKAVDRPTITSLQQHYSATQRNTYYLYYAQLAVTILSAIGLTSCYIPIIVNRIHRDLSNVTSTDAVLKEVDDNTRVKQVYHNNGQSPSDTDETIQTDEEGTTNKSKQTNEARITNETIQSDGEGATNEIIQRDGEGATNEIIQTDGERARNETIQRDKEGVEKDKKGDHNDEQLPSSVSTNDTVLRFEDEESNEKLIDTNSESTGTLEEDTKESNDSRTTSVISENNYRSIINPPGASDDTSSTRHNEGDYNVAHTRRSEFKDPVACSENHSEIRKEIRNSKDLSGKTFEEDNSEVVVDLKKTKTYRKPYASAKDSKSTKYPMELTEFERRQRNRRNHWKEIDKTLYHDTNASKTIWRKIDKENCVSILIVGPESSGKSVTAAHLGFKFETHGYELLFLNLPDQVEGCLKVGHCQVFVIEKPLGNQDIEKDLEQWEKLSRNIESTFENNNTKIIMTLSTRLYRMFEIRLCKTLFGDKGKVFNLSDKEYNLSVEDRKCIFKNHKDKGQFKDDASFDDKVIKEDSLPHFLIWCNIISNKPKEDRINEMKDKTDLYDFYRTGIKVLQNDFKNQYCCLVLVVLFDCSFDINALSECKCDPEPIPDQGTKIREKVTTIVNSCGIDCKRENILLLEKSFDDLLGTYLKPNSTESEYNILNNVVTEIVIELYCPKNLLVVLKYGSSTFIRRFVRSSTSQFRAEERTGTVQITNSLQGRFATRLIDDLGRGKISDVFDNPSFEDPTFVRTFGKEMKNLNSEQIMTLMKQIPSFTMHPTSSADSLSPDVVLAFSSPVHWLCRLGLKDLLDIVCKKCRNPQAFIKNIPGQLSPLHFAARYGHLSVVKYLVEEMQLSINCTPSRGSQYTPLFYAKRHNHVDVTNYLSNITEKPSTTDPSSPRLGKTSIS